MTYFCFKFVTCNSLPFSDDEIIGDQSTPRISVVVTNVVSDPVATSTTTSSATSAGHLVASVSQMMSPSVATSVQSSVAGPSSISAEPFYSTRAATSAAHRTVPSAASPAVPQIGKGKGRGGKRGKGPAARAPVAPAAASAAVPFLSYDDPDLGNPPQYPHPKFSPARTPGIHLEGPLLRNSMVKPIEFFQLFFTREIVESIVMHTNTYAYIRIAAGEYKSYTCSDGSWQETTSDEIRRLIALLIYFGLVKVVGDVSKYWSTASLYHGLWARAIMPRVRFQALMSFLHIVDPLNEPAGNKLRKVEALVQYFKTRCQLLHQPRQHVAIDERMVKSRHRSGIRQYIKDKPTKWGIKLWVLADSSNAYVQDFNIYIGKQAGREISKHGLGYDVVMTLMHNYLDQGYHLFIDNFYTSVTLAKHLFDRGTLVTGTIIDSRRDLPASLKNGKVWAKGKPKGTMRWERDAPVLALQWVDNKVVSMITTCGNANETTQVSRKRKAGGTWSATVVQQPEVFHMYNQYMNAVDRSDQILATHNVQRKCMTWWKTLFFHLIDMAVVNSFILFKEQQRKFPDNEALRRPAKYSLASYREELVRDICNFPAQDVPPSNENVQELGSFDIVHCPIVVDVRRQCVVCVREGRGRFGVSTSCRAPQCQGLHMHITREQNCYEVFHSRQFQRKFCK